MNPSIELLQQQLSALQSAQKPTIEPVSSPQVSIEDIRRMVQEEVTAKLELLKGSLAIPKEEIPTKVANQAKELTIQESIGLSLTEEEQLWLSQSDKLLGIEKHLPEFFQTEDGKLAIQSFMIFYRGKYEN